MTAFIIEQINYKISSFYWVQCDQGSDYDLIHGLIYVGRSVHVGNERHANAACLPL